MGARHGAVATEALVSSKEEVSERAVKFTFEKSLHRILTFELRRSGKAVNLTLSFLVCRLWHYQTRLSTNNSWCAECIWHYRRCISCSLLCKFTGLVIYFIPTAISVAQQNLNFLFPVTIIHINILWLSDCLYTYHKKYMAIELYTEHSMNCIQSTMPCFYLFGLFKV